MLTTGFWASGYLDESPLMDLPILLPFLLYQEFQSILHSGGPSCSMQRQENECGKP